MKRKNNNRKTFLNDIKSEKETNYLNPIIEKIITPETSMEKKMIAEKIKLGFKQNQICFVATADIASMYWCDQQMLFRIRQNELNMFESYLHDIEREGELTEKEIEKKVSELVKKQKTNQDKKDMDTLETKKWIIQGINITKTNRKPNLSLSEILSKKDLEILDKCKNDLEVLEKFDQILERTRIKLKLAKTILFDTYTVYSKLDYAFLDILSRNSNANSDMRRGIKDEMSFAQRYPTFRYHFRWNNYIIEAVPDGIGPDFCYEFKSTKKWNMLHYIKPIAEAQAQLYSYFFKKPKIKIEIYINEADKKLTYDMNANEKKAIEILARMDRLINEKEKPIPPKEWKCKKCIHRNECKIKQF
ncbi:MAG: Dna2/Cas4 domain-containing protein [Candidatus Micrarchaeia archaeon]